MKTEETKKALEKYQRFVDSQLKLMERKINGLRQPDEFEKIGKDASLQQKKPKIYVLYKEYKAMQSVNTILKDKLLTGFPNRQLKAVKTEMYLREIRRISSELHVKLVDSLEGGWSVSSKNILSKTVQNKAWSDSHPQLAKRYNIVKELDKLLQAGNVKAYEDLYKQHKLELAQAVKEKVDSKKTPIIDHLEALRAVNHSDEKALLSLIETFKTALREVKMEVKPRNILTEVCQQGSTMPDQKKQIDQQKKYDAVGKLEKILIDIEKYPKPIKRLEVFEAAYNSYKKDPQLLTFCKKLKTMFDGSLKKFDVPGSGVVKTVGERVISVLTFASNRSNPHQKFVAAKIEAALKPKAK